MNNEEVKLMDKEMQKSEHMLINVLLIKCFPFEHGFYSIFPVRCDIEWH